MSIIQRFGFDPPPSGWQLQDYPTPYDNSYWHSREPGTGPGTGTLHADDNGKRGGPILIVDGAFWEHHCDSPAAAPKGTWPQDKGWCGSIHVDVPDPPRGVRSGRTPFGTFCGSQGFINGNNSNLAADHAWAYGVDEFYMRWYWSHDEDYVWGGQKGPTINHVVEFGGIRWFNFGVGSIGGANPPLANPNLQWVDNYKDATTPSGKQDLDNISSYSLGGDARTDWHCMQLYMKMNSGVNVQDGILKFWADNCGTNGIPAQGLDGAPTLRGLWEDVAWKRTGAETGQFAACWFENWSPSNFSSIGEELFDMIWVKDAAFQGSGGNNPLPFCHPYVL